MSDISEHLGAKDPLTRDIAYQLISHDEEDQYLDYKLTVETSSEKEWLGLTKDISAFANTFGGYLVFGVKDEDKSLDGLDQQTVNYLKDADKVMAKINRHLEPEILNLRTKSFRFEQQRIVVLYIPRSTNVTHIIKKDGAHTLQSGDKKVVLRKGTFYVRRVGGNHLGDSRDLDDLVERRIDSFREALLGKVATVVNAPIESQVYLLSRDPNDSSGQRFVIEDSPDAIGVKGLSFSVAPETQEEEVAAWTVLAKNRPKTVPSLDVVWDWYYRREEMNVSEIYRLALFKFSLLSRVPASYWIKDIENTKIKPVLLDAIRSRPASIPAKPFLQIASFLGKASYKHAVQAFGPYSDRLGSRLQNFPTRKPYDEHANLSRKKSEALPKFRRTKLTELNTIAEEAAKTGKSPGVIKIEQAQKIDLFLYARLDNYKNHPN